MTARRKNRTPPNYRGAQRIEEYRNLSPGDQVRVRGANGRHGFRAQYIATWIEPAGTISVQVREHERGIRHVRPERIVRKRKQNVR